MNIWKREEELKKLKIIFPLLKKTYHKVNTFNKSRINLKKEREKSINFLNKKFNVDSRKYYEEYLKSDFREFYNKKFLEVNRIEDISSNFDCETLYLVIRCLKPEIVVETGVLYGASASHILEALEKNKKGKLYSIDLPVEENDDLHDSKHQGILIREKVKKRWNLVLGDTRKELPKLLDKLPKIDFFFHDSSHFYENMLLEYETVKKHMNKNKILSSHDVNNLFRKPFHQFCKKYNLEPMVFRNVGITFV